VKVNSTEKVITTARIGSQQRQRDVPEALPGRRAVERGRLVERGRDRLQAGQQADRDEGDAAPDIGRDGRPARVPRLSPRKSM
jgi:hypothetical protein